MKILATSLVLALTALSAEAASFSFTGNFAGDADVVKFGFTVGALSDVTLRSYSYGGGVMADGTTIDAGGFDPILALFDNLGNFIAQFDDGPGPVPTDPVTGAAWDTNLTLFGLAAGSYTATITQYANFAIGNLADGFSESSSTFTSQYLCTNGQFCDAGSNNRTNAWAFDVLNVNSAVVVPPIPLPAALPLMVLALGSLGFAAGRRTKRSK